MNDLLIGLDIGTSGAKCIAADAAGRVVASATREYPLYTPRAGWAEQDPEDWWTAVRSGLAAILSNPEVKKESIRGISFSGQMHGLVALDANHKVIRPAILWCDQRTQRQCDDVVAQAGGLDRLLSYTNNQMLTGYTGGKILWLRDEEPQHFERMTKFVCPKDYIRLKLIGEIATDASDASGTGFYDTKNRCWSEALIRKVGLDPALFPEVHESIDLAGRVTAQAAEETGLPQGVPVCYGGGDAVIQTTGAGLVRPGILGVVIGTAGNVSMATDHFCENPDGALQMFCNNAPGLWHALGCTLTAGGAFRWYRDELARDQIAEAKRTGRNVYALLDEEAAQSNPGANGVIFTPYLTGERCPYPDANARGTFYGLSLSTHRADLTRAVMEGVVYSLKQVVDRMSAFAHCEKVYASGGGSASPLWRQMQADIFNLPVYTMSAASEGGAYGAIMVAGVGTGVWKNLDEAASIVRVETETLPNPANRSAYEDAFGVYDKIYPALREIWK